MSDGGALVVVEFKYTICTEYNLKNIYQYTAILTQTDSYKSLM